MSTPGSWAEVEREGGREGGCCIQVSGNRAKLCQESCCVVTVNYNLPAHWVRFHIVVCYGNLLLVPELVKGQSELMRFSFQE